jgi:hypothetical protein
VLIDDAVFKHERAHAKRHSTESVELFWLPSYLVTVIHDAVEGLRGVGLKSLKIGELTVERLRVDNLDVTNTLTLPPGVPVLHEHSKAS